MDNLDIFTNFLAEIGVEDPEMVLAQLRTQYDDDQIYDFAGRPSVYEKFAQTYSQLVDDSTDALF